MTKSAGSPLPTALAKSPTLITSDGTHDFANANNASNSLRALLQGSRLAVLAGSGTSYGLTGDTGSAPMMGDLFTQVQTLHSYKDLLNEHPSLSSETNVEILLSKAQALVALGSSTYDVETFISEATDAIQTSCNFVDDSTELEPHRIFLRKLVTRSTDGERLALFTTNYDLAFETALQELRIAAIDGFGYGSRMKFSGANFRQDLAVRGPRGELQLAPEVTRLFKLHGSVDWDERSSGIYRSQNPTNPVLIYPSSNKYQQSYRQPFLEAMSQYQATLRTSETTLLVVGFGFNDAHLNQPIIDALLGDPTFKVIVAAPDVSTNGNHVLEQFRKSIAAGDGRIGLFSGTFAELASLLPDPPTTDPWQETKDALQLIWGRS